MDKIRIFNLSHVSLIPILTLERLWNQDETRWAIKTV